MTYTVDHKEAKLRGMPDVAIVDEIMDNNTGEYLDEDGYMREYQKYLDSLPIYDIEPGEWKGITEVKDGEFVLEYQQNTESFYHPQWKDCDESIYNIHIPRYRRIIARPKPTQVEAIETMDSLKGTLQVYKDTIKEQEKEIERLKEQIMLWEAPLKQAEENNDSPF